MSNLVESNGQRFTVRPEKIRIVDEKEPASNGYQGQTGRIREVVYLGPVTRYIVELDGGGELVAVKQNLETSSQDALDARGRRVRLEWRPEYTFAIN